MHADTNNSPGQTLIGCAGWTIPRDDSAAFPTEGTHLSRYAQLFKVVEINSSFYRSHQPKTYARWADSVPDDFRFSVKLPRTITHEAKLVDVDSLLARFAEETAALGTKLGCVLMQLPPSLSYEAALAAQMFASVARHLGCMLACEARHASWFSDDATGLLRAHGVTRVIADPPAGQPGPHVPTTANIYVRLHGAPRVYYSSYAPEYLAALASDMAVHASAGRAVWCIFDNTASGAAMPNALALRRHLQGGSTF